MPATAAWLASAEALINRGIDASAQAGALARRLQGTALQIDVDGIMHIRAAAFGGRLALLAADAAAAGGAGAADATISGSLPALLRMFNSGANRQSGRLAAPGAAAQIRGDAEIANLYRDLFLLGRPDLEEELSRWIGDFAARRVSQVAARALAFARHARRTAGDNIAEYLQEESRDLVNQTELEEFLQGVDTLRETADRIDARLASLEQRLAGGV
jgi:ubiquinone biosynthesis protein UbiJ